MSNQRAVAQTNGSKPSKARAQGAAPTASRAPESPLLKLQRTIGNKAVQRMIQAPVAEESGPGGIDLASHLDVGMNSPGHAMDDASKAFMESRFGFDFSQVRLHTDAAAARSAEAFNAKAYTVGQDIVFGEGQYSPGSSDGQRLMAHELTHVVQRPEASSASCEISISEPHDMAEQEAEETASQITSPESALAPLAKPVAAVQTGASDSVTGNKVSRDESDEQENPVSTAGSIVDIAEGAFGGALEGAGQIFGPAQLLMAGDEFSKGDAISMMKGAAETTSGVGNTVGLLGTLMGGEEAAAGAAGAAEVGAGAVGAEGLASLGPVGAAALAGIAGGTGIAELAGSSLTKTGAFGVDPDTGKNQSAMDWGAGWGTSVDKALGNTEPSVLGGIAAGAGGIVGGIGGALYGAGNWLFGDNDND